MKRHSTNFITPTKTRLNMTQTSYFNNRNGSPMVGTFEKVVKSILLFDILILIGTQLSPKSQANHNFMTLKSEQIIVHDKSRDAKIFGNSYSTQEDGFTPVFDATNRREFMRGLNEYVGKRVLNENLSKQLRIYLVEKQQELDDKQGKMILDSGRNRYMKIIGATPKQIKKIVLKRRNKSVFNRNNRIKKLRMSQITYINDYDQTHIVGRHKVKPNKLSFSESSYADKFIKK